MADWQTIDAYLHGLGIRIDAPNAGQTTGGIHVASSEHYQGRARDYGVYDSDAPAVCRAMLPFAQGPSHVVDELFFTPLNVFFKNGRPTVLGRTEIQIHENHCHVGIVRGGQFPKPSSPQEASSMLNKPICAIVDDPSGDGYWLVGGDGGIFAFGSAMAFGNDPLPSEKLNGPIVAACASRTGKGLRLAGSDGGVFCFGDAGYHGRAQ